MDRRKGAWCWTVDKNKSGQGHLFCLLSWRIRKGFFRVTAGLHDRSTPGGQAQIRLVSEIIMHKGYNHATTENDVTLLLLSSPFKFSDYIQPACLPHSVTHELLLNFSHCFISGWGSSYFKGLFLTTSSAWWYSSEENTQSMPVSLNNSDWPGTEKD